MCEKPKIPAEYKTQRFEILSELADCYRLLGKADQAALCTKQAAVYSGPVDEPLSPSARCALEMSR